ncbi:hypothetical protein [Rhizobium sp.]
MTPEPENSAQHLVERIEELERKVRELTRSVALAVDRLGGDEVSSVWTYDARFPAQSANTYEAEYWDDMVKRWVGPAPKLEFFPRLLGDRTYVITARIPDFINDVAEKSFRISVDGMAVKSRELPREVATRVFEAEFSAELAREYIVVLETGFAETPQVLFGSQDTRKLSFSIASVLIVERNISA